jgi:hypothetical protein
VLKGIAGHDDGWVARDSQPSITRQGKPSAFSIELVGKCSTFEEMDIEESLGVRARALRIIAEQNPYAGLLISMHTCNLLNAHAAALNSATPAMGRNSTIASAHRRAPQQAIIASSAMSALSVFQDERVEFT